MAFGTYVYNRLAMGWVNATAEFQRAINHTLGDCLWRNALAMVDDLVVASPDTEQHILDLWEVFAKLASRAHSLKPSKVNLFCDRVDYLGHVSTEDGYSITAKHKVAIAQMPYLIGDRRRLRLLSRAEQSSELLKAQSG